MGFQPFQAWRYNLKRVILEEVIAPPYDIISEEKQNILYERSPQNCTRLILNKIEKSDDEQNNRYIRAKRFFKKLQEEDILIQDTEPCFYLYRQTFSCGIQSRLFSRFALLGRFKLESFGKDTVIPHEKTLLRPREDRRKLLECTEANFSPIFGLYKEPTGEMGCLISKLSQNNPAMTATDDEGVVHDLWLIHDQGAIQNIQAILKSRVVYIADGHHRYQTALDYARQKHQRDKIPFDQTQPFDYVLMALVEFDDPGLVLMPTHRVVLPFDGFQKEKALESLKLYFDVESVARDKLFEEFDRARTSVEMKGALGSAISFGLVFGESETYRITLKDLEGFKQLVAKDKPDVWYQLDVNLLGYGVLTKLFGLGEDQWESKLRFAHTASGVMKTFQSEGACVGFLLKALPVQSLQEMGQVGELMPQKSTYFYPKLASGLVLYQHS